MIAISTLRETLDFDPSSGMFYWRAQRGPRKAGSLAGYTNAVGYWCIHVDGETHAAHRLAWAYHYGEWPVLQVDHINRDKLDNRICNLRLATPRQNNANHVVRRDSHSQVKGVARHPGTGRWRARIRTPDGRTRHLGYFPDVLAAQRAYERAAEQIHGEFAISGRALVRAADALAGQENRLNELDQS